MPQLLEGKTALILGVANKWSIAYAIAQAYRREGAKLLLTYQGDRLKETVEQLGAELDAARVLECDVAQDEHLARLSETLQADGPLHTVVHSIAFAGKDELSRPFLETSRAGFAQAQEISAYSMVAVARAAAPAMTAGGAMLTLTYLGSTRVLTNYNVMGTAKASLEASVRYLASELGPKNIRVNAISAGPIKTASARGIAGFSKILEQVAARSPLGRNVDPAEVADMAVFLASDLGRGVTGDVLFVDAGYHIMGL
jgi:enoyl-[acyl-carrier protein] reductase I